ncbi:MAG: hypothetical protein RIS60_2096 [Pseudomonadota bacterium]
MTIDINRRDVLQAGLAGAVSIAMPAMAQGAFPSKPIKLICPWPAGGSTDGVMRALAESASRILGSPVVIENKAGASGMLGPNELVSAKPDGYTLSQLTIGILRLPHMQKMQFNPLQDFTFIACLTGYTFGIVVRSDSPIKSIKDLVDYAKANPGKFTFGSTGNGTTPHLAVEEFAMKAGIQLQHCLRWPRDVAQRRHRLGAACGRWHLPFVGYLRQQTHQALAQCTHLDRVGLRHRIRLAIWHWRPQGHGPCCD